MTYAPIWAERAEEMRKVLALIDLDRPESPAEAALYQIARTASTSVQAAFPDVSRELLGWVLLDASAGLRQIIDMAPTMPSHRLPALLLVIGKVLVEGAA